MEAIGFIADGIGIAGAIFALFAWLQARRLRSEQRTRDRRDNEMVTIVLKHKDDGSTYTLPGTLRRKELTRAEVLGRIGMVPRVGGEQDRYKLPYLNAGEFLQSIDRVVDGAGDALLIVTVDAAEWDRFKLPQA
ncbi:MAG: hypothetical protein JNL42_15465 [Anaerolineae bacterium]|nr:hypothetical protein [Anaerolineae bacterium]